MKSIGIILLIICLATSIWAQSDIVENTVQDSQPVQVEVIDSLNIEADIDSLKENIDPRLLLIEMNNFLVDKREMEDEFFIPHLIYNENFHLSSPFDLNVRIKKNGFSEIPFALGNLQILQNNQNFYNTIYKRGNIFYNSLRYSLPVAITETYMGLGDIDMNNISVSLIKGSILGNPAFDMQLNFLGEKGKWLGYEDEASQNFHLHLSYDLGFSKIHFDNSFIDQALPGEKHINGYQHPFQSTINEEKEYSITVENEILNVGFKYKQNDYEMGEVFSKERNLLQVLAKKKFQTPNHFIDVSYEFVSEDIEIDSYSNPDTMQTVLTDNKYYIFSGDHESNIFGFNIGNTAFYQDENNFQFDTELIKKLSNSFNVLGEFTTKSNEYFANPLVIYPRKESRSNVGGGVFIDSPIINLKAIIGQHHIEDFNGNYRYLESTVNLGLTKNVGIIYDLWVRNEKTTYRVENNTDVMRYPEWQISGKLELIYHLKYNNAIKLGVKHIHHSNYSYTLDDLEVIFRNDSQNFDAYLKIQLTDRFEISVDAINLTNNNIMFTNSNHAGTHFNFNVHWIFIN